MTTARDIVTKALQKNGVLTKDDNLSGDEASDGLFSLNAMLSSWSNENLLVYATTFESFPLQNNKATYTLGAGGDFDTVRPIDISNAYVRQGGIDYPLSIISQEAYDSSPIKDVGSIPDTVSTDNGFPLMTLSFFPAPYAGLTVFLRTLKPLVDLTSLDTVLSLPSGWERALIYNLAVEIGGEYGAQIDQVTYQIAQESKGMIKKAVAKNRPMDAYPQIGRRDNIYSGYYN